MVSNMSEHFQFRHQSFLLNCLVLVCLMQVNNTKYTFYQHIPKIPMAYTID